MKMDKSDSRADQAGLHGEHGLSERDKHSNRHLPSESGPDPHIMLLECEDHGPLLIPTRPRFQHPSGNGKKAETRTTSKVSQSHRELSGVSVRKDPLDGERQLQSLEEIAKEDVCEEKGKKEEADVRTSLRKMVQRTAETLQDTLTSSSGQITQCKTLDTCRLPRREMPRRGKRKTDTPCTPLRRKTRSTTRSTTKTTQEHVTKSLPSNGIGKKTSKQTRKSRQPPTTSKLQDMRKKSSRKKRQKGTEIAVDDGKLGVNRKQKTQRREVTRKTARQKTVPVPVRGKDAVTKKAESEESYSEKSVGLRRSARNKEAPVYFEESSPDSDGDDLNDLEQKCGRRRKRSRKGSVSEQSYSGKGSGESGPNSEWNSTVQKKRKSRNSKECPALYKCNHCSFVSTYEFKLNAHLSRDHSLAVKNWAPRKPRGNRKQHKCPQCHYTSEKTPVIYNHTITVHKGTAVCVSCSFTGNSLEEMLKHEDEVHPRCKMPRCRFKTDDPEKLAEHMNMHHKLKCPDCNKIFQTKKEYIRHGAKAHGKKLKAMKKTARAIGMKVLQCDKCDYKASKAGHLKTHILCKHTKREDLKYACTICDYRSPFQSWINTHMQQKHQDALDVQKKYRYTIYKCDECGNESRTKFSLQVHRLKKHGLGEGPLKCKHCDYATTNNSRLAKHMKNDHGIEIKRCMYCRHYWGNRADMETHHQTCKYKGEFLCEECSFFTTAKCKLMSHMKKKHGVGRSHELCHHCGKIFYGSYAFEQHLMTHLPNKPFRCPYESCKYETIYKANMPAHLLIHTGEKPYRCDVCSYASVQKSNLNTHMKKHYKVGKPTTRGRANRTGCRKKGRKQKEEMPLEKDSEDEMETATSNLIGSEGRDLIGSEESHLIGSEESHLIASEESHLIGSEDVNQMTDTHPSGRMGGMGIMERDSGGPKDADSGTEDEGKTSEDEHEETMDISEIVQDREEVEMDTGACALGSLDYGNDYEKE